MFGNKPLAVVVAIAFALTLAPLAHAQGGTTPASGAPAKASAAKPAPAAPAGMKEGAKESTKEGAKEGEKEHAKAAGGKTAPEMKVDLNSATKEELMKIPGIGDAIADKIIQARPFKAKNELLKKGLVNKAQYAKFAPHVIAKQAGAPAKAK